jgi:hypothetical protein
LSAELPALVGSLAFKKSMRWNSNGVAYSRPMRWLLALHGAQPVPFSYGGVTAAPATRVLRNAASPEMQVGVSSRESSKEWSCPAIAMFDSMSCCFSVDNCLQCAPNVRKYLSSLQA